METLEITTHPNATACKLTNKRVIVERLEEDSFGLVFKVLDLEGANEPAANHMCVKGKVRITAMRISKKAAMALYIALQRQLN